MFHVEKDPLQIHGEDPVPDLLISLDESRVLPEGAPSAISLALPIF
jgi:hypothetical protein